MKWRVVEACPEPGQASKMDLFVKIGNGLNPLTIFEKSSILDVWLCSEYVILYDYVINEVWVGKELMSLIPMKKQQKIKAFLNGTDVINVE